MLIKNINDTKYKIMKKYIFLAVSALLFVACSNDEEIDNWNGEIRLCTTTQLQTRATQDLQTTQFAANEKVDVFINEDASSPTYIYPQPIEYTADGTGGLKTSVDTPRYPTTGNGVNIFGVYPAGIAFNIDEDVNFSVMADQSSDANYNASDLMIGAAANPVSRQAGSVAVTFSHMLSKININVVIGTGLTADSLANATVSILNTMPSTTFNIKRGEIGAASGGQAAAFDITVGTLSANAMNHSAIIVPQEMEEATEFIQIVLDSGTKLTYILPANTTFTSGNVYTYNLTANRYEITATTSINDWVTGAEVTGEASN